jgi:CHAT domain-containing protein
LESWNSSFDDKKKDLAKVIDYFLNTSSVSDAHKILEQHPELLNNKILLILDSLLKSVQSKEVIDAIQNHIDLLHLCREIGIQQAFEKISCSSDNVSADDLQIILNEIDRLSRPQDLPEKITMLQRALSLVQRQSNPELWAALKAELGKCIRLNTQIDQANDMESAIENCKQALEVYTKETFPVEWAATLNSLAIAYWSRIKGDKADNIEKAIKCCFKALEVRTQKDFPVEWATTIHNLALVYSDRILGDRAANIEKAIGYYNQALEVRTQKEFPAEWAMTQNNLGNTYGDRIRGDRAENIEKAIEHYNQALEVRTQKDFPIEWAETQNNLAFAFWNRNKGDQIENIEQAIKHYNQALEVYNQVNISVDWAATMHNLALAYWRRIRGDRAENIEKAIECYNQALDVFTFQNFPIDWAMNLNNLANAYSDRIQGDKADNIEKAIGYYNQALKVRTQNNFPEKWAETQNNLGLAYLNRIKGHRAFNIEQSIEHCNQAFKVYLREKFPIEWAAIQNNLANAYKNRIRGSTAKNIEQAIMYCINTLDVYKLESMPNTFRRACGLLGDLYLDAGFLKSAMLSYKVAIKACDILYSFGLSSESKGSEVIASANIYRNATLAAFRSGLITEALLTLEGGKTRLLDEALRLKMKQPSGVPNEDWIKYEQAAEKYLTATKLSDSKKVNAQKEKEVQKALEEIDTAVKVVKMYNPEFQKKLDIYDILSILDEETALMTFCITDEGSIGSIVSRSRGVKSFDIPEFRIKELNTMLFNSNGKELLTGSWVGDYLSYCDASNAFNHHINENNKKGIEIEKQLFEADKRLKDAFQAWQKTLNNVLVSVGTTLLSPLLADLPSRIKRLILLPSGGLFLLPLHAVPLSDGQLLCQRFCISYVPSIQLLKEMQNKVVTAKGKGLYAVINPEEDSALVFSRYEGQVISKFFQSSQMSVGKFGTKPTVLDGVLGRAYLHFSCHGSYDWNDPPRSGLYLFGGRTLSLADFQNDVVDMSSARLVTLSACETGITDIVKGSADEFVGLPAGFMLAGVPCVVSSLWSVPEISTALLMERFYSNHINRKMDIPQALQDAQLWVRDLTSSQVADYVEKCYSSSKWEGKSKEFIEQKREHYFEMAEESPNEKSFQHPYYWAAFTAYGA